MKQSLAFLQARSEILSKAQPKYQQPTINPQDPDPVSRCCPLVHQDKYNATTPYNLQHWPDDTQVESIVSSDLDQAIEMEEKTRVDRVTSRHT